MYIRMNKESFWAKEKKYVYRLLNYDGRIPLYKLSRDHCSEVSRLLADRLLRRFPKSKLYIAKGELKARAHDVIFFEPNGGVFYIIDPTIWQIFKMKKSILVSDAKNLNDALKILSRMYSGKWKISEKVTGYSSGTLNGFYESLT